MAPERPESIDSALAKLEEIEQRQGAITPDDIAEALPPDEERSEERERQLLEMLHAEIERSDLTLKEAEEEDPLATDRGHRTVPLPVPAGSGDDTISLYLREIGAIPLLTADDEKGLARCYERGRASEEILSDEDAVAGLTAAERKHHRERMAKGLIARERMIQANSRLVVHIAKKYTNNGVPFMDLIQEGNLGLIRAVEKFDWKRGYKFSTYATWWIRQAITRALADLARTIRVPVHMSEQISKERAIRRRLEQELGRDPTLEEMAKEMGITAKKVERIREIAQRPLSLEMKVGEENDSELGHFLEDEDTIGPTEYAGLELLRDQMTEALESLSEREADVLRLRYGLDGGKPHTLEEVGEQFGVTRERIRQIETKAIRRLRHPTRSKKLRDYLRDD